MFWWTEAGSRGNNFGDRVSPKIVKHLSGRKIERTTSGGSGRLLAVGSILKWALPGDIIWGAGHAVLGHSNARDIDVRCVRGPITEWILRAQGVKIPRPRTWGDPALLLPAIYQPPVLERSFEDIFDAPLIVPHYIDYKRARELLRPDVAVLDITADTEVVIDSICKSSIVLSSSLHGIVVAEAYGIPAVWVEFSDHVSGAGMKFRDYYASTGRERVILDALDFRHGFRFDAKIADRVFIPERPAMIARVYDLIGSFPFEIAPGHLDLPVFSSISQGWAPARPEWRGWKEP